METSDRSKHDTRWALPKTVLASMVAMLLSHCGYPPKSDSATAAKIPDAVQVFTNKGGNFIPIPSLFSDSRVQYGSHGVILITLDREILSEHALSLARIYNVGTDVELINPAVFNDQPSVSISIKEGIESQKFTFGENILRIDLQNQDREVFKFNERKIFIYDNQIATPTLNTEILTPNSAGHVEFLQVAVHYAEGESLSIANSHLILISGLIPMVFQ